MMIGGNNKFKIVARRPLFSIIYLLPYVRHGEHKVKDLLVLN